jgi:predicted nuclease of predicted toxin-antitoxin system
MPLSLYFDVHVAQSVVDQLRERGVDVQTAFNDGAVQLDDAEVLERARAQGRVIFTHDIRLKQVAEAWQREHRAFGGLLFGQVLQGNVGRFVSDLERLAKNSETADWANSIEYIPIRRISK